MYLVRTGQRVEFIKRAPRKEEKVIIRPDNNDFRDWCNTQKKKMSHGNTLVEFHTLYRQVVKASKERQPKEDIEIDIFFNDLTDLKQQLIIDAFQADNKESLLLGTNWDIQPMTTLLITADNEEGDD